MRNPVALLGILLALALVAGGGLWILSHRGDHRRPTAPPAAGTPEASDESGMMLAELKRDVADLVVRNRELENENAQLRRRVEELESADKYTPAAIAETIAAIRGLDFQRPLTFRPTPRTEVEAAVADAVLARYPEGELAAKERALRALGFIFDDGGAPIAEALVGLETNQRVAHYDDAIATLFYRDDLDLRGPADRGRLVPEIAAALLEQNFGKVEPARDSADAALAAAALPIGDATQIKLRYSLSDDSGGAPPPAPESQEKFYGAPVFLREQALFPYYQGSKFVQALQQSGGWEAVNAAYRRPPSSTAEVLHPDLYLAEPPFAPEDVEAPATGDAAGEFGINALLATQLDPFAARDAADGWAGDRYVVDDDNTYVWTTRWRTAEDAEQFAAAIGDYIEAVGRIVPVAVGGDGVVVTVGR